MRGCSYAVTCLLFGFIVLCFVIDTPSILLKLKVAKRVKVDFPRQENVSNSSFSEMLPRKNHMKGLVKFLYHCSLCTFLVSHARLHINIANIVSLLLNIHMICSCMYSFEFVRFVHCFYPLLLGDCRISL